eukprot:COSAG02_NODE_51008_length_317_cov_0.637615_1_plen_66_part_01
MSVAATLLVAGPQAVQEPEPQPQATDNTHETAQASGNTAAAAAFFKQKTAYEIMSGDWSSDVCSSD